MFGLDIRVLCQFWSSSGCWEIVELNWIKWHLSDWKDSQSEMRAGVEASDTDGIASQIADTFDLSFFSPLFYTFFVYVLHSPSISFFSYMCNITVSKRFSKHQPYRTYPQLTYTASCTLSIRPLHSYPHLSRPHLFPAWLSARWNFWQAERKVSRAGRESAARFRWWWWFCRSQKWKQLRGTKRRKRAKCEGDEKGNTRSVLLQPFFNTHTLTLTHTHTLSPSLYVLVPSTRILLSCRNITRFSCNDPIEDCYEANEDQERRR